MAVLDCENMEKPLIRPGQVWLADVYGRETRVLVIASRAENPRTWLCERVAKGEDGPGPQFILRQKAFLRPD